MSSWLDHLPTNERQRIRERFHLSEAEYEQLREKVKGPEDLKQEMEHNALLAELKFAMDSEPKLSKALKEQLEEDIQKNGLEAVVEETRALPKEAKNAVASGKFVLTVAANPTTHEDQIMVVPEGNVAEKLPVKPVFSEKYLSQFQQAI